MADNDPPSKKDFFISYNKADREWAEWLAWHLEDSGSYSVIIQAWDFGAGCNFVLEMDRAIRECERVLAVLSPDYLTSLFTKPEWAAYFAQDSTGQDRRIVPVRVRECEPKGLLAAIVYADLVGKPDTEAKAALLEAVKLGRRKPESAPGFPGRKVVNKPRFPGALPEIWNVPHLRNPNFTEPGGRLTEMRDALRNGRPAALTQALAGLGGVGKTQLAIEYAYRFAADYGIVWWVRSEQAATLAADYAALATKLDLAEKDAAEQPIIVSAVRDALQQRRDWLLIFDNANGPEEIRDYLPAQGGHILITSRHAAWGGVAQTVPVKRWASEVAVEFLLKRTGHTDVDAAKELGSELDYFPLALEQAASYIDSAQKTLLGYLALFRQHHLDVLKRGKPASGYPATVGTTWELSFQRLEVESPGGAVLLQFCSFLGPDDIPRDLIATDLAQLPESLRETVNDPLAFDEAVSAIRRYSLIEVRGDSTLSMHRLVQAVVRDRLEISERRRWVVIAVNVVNNMFPKGSSDVRTWKECDRLLPHAIAATELAENLNVGWENTASLVNRVGTYAFGRAEYAKAKAATERALKIAESALGSDHPTVAVYLNNLGAVLRTVGDFAEAKASYERAISIGQKTFGPDHHQVAAYLSNLGGVLRDLGDFVGAKAAIERALKIDEKVFGAHSPDVATDVNNLGTVLASLGDLTGAKTAFERAFKIDEESLGIDHPEVATDLNNIGSVLTDLGDFTEAKAAFERALKIAEKQLGPDHPKVAISLNNIGRLARKQGDLGLAKGVYERALRIDEKTFGSDHFKIGTRLSIVASLLRDLGDFSGAKKAYERALKIFQRSLGESHPNTRRVREDLASLGSQ